MRPLILFIYPRPRVPEECDRFSEGDLQEAAAAQAPLPAGHDAGDAVRHDGEPGGEVSI